MRIKVKIFLYMFISFVTFTSIVWIYSQNFIKDINAQWAHRFIQKQVTFDKNRTLLPILRELKIVKQMAFDTDIINMATHITSFEARQKGILAFEEYKNLFKDRNYFAAFSYSNEYFYNNASNDFSGKQKRYVLSQKNLDDSWFFYTISQNDDFQVNVNKDTKLGVTKVWIDYVVKSGDKKVAVVGTGFDFDSFLKESVGAEQEGVKNFFVNKDLAIQLARDTELIDYASMTKSDGQHKTLDLLFVDKNDISNIKNIVAYLEKNPKEIKTLWVNFEDKHRLLGIAYLEEIGWYSFTFIDSKELSLIDNSIIVPLLSVVFSLILFGMGFLLNYMIFSPLKKLQLMMKKVEQGDYLDNLESIGKGEIQELSKQFNTMVNYVQESNELLEIKVKERTKDLEVSQERIKQLAFFDELTSLPNRRMLEDRLNMAIAKAKRNKTYGALLVVDIDNFKPVNDKYGHNVGDLLLIQIAQRLKKSVREEDTVGRFGGDEFLIILNELDKEEELAKQKALQIANKIIEILAEPYDLLYDQIDDLQSYVTHKCSASIGLTLFDTYEGDTNNKIFQRADKAMYSAKENGKNNVSVLL